MQTVESIIFDNFGTHISPFFKCCTEFDVSFTSLNKEYLLQKYLIFLKKERGDVIKEQRAKFNFAFNFDVLLYFYLEYIILGISSIILW